MNAGKFRAATGARGDESFLPNLGKRQAAGRRWAAAFAAATIAAVLVLGALVASIVNDAFGLVAMEYTVDPATLAPGGFIVFGLILGVSNYFAEKAARRKAGGEGVSRA